ncbi:glycosyltransferase involved in cell wall biosynthesis [Roseiarcus fermentans]|uniref:Glycosyltransferase involved in cell wall biosynthesis n=1 Tax=Roseiarcus fermentans TaxID=1473586 RepID=A0A366ETF5_9HYPH|nr:glycosyltransferase family 4 protein [Roseiarcus fermentans]RBP05678.1 glycosyltransferase involved in cell wall biosynthesis [Roseiarcus fermentans]
MRIAQIAPLQESVPPKLYGGTERVVSYLTEELVRQGHDVTLFASGDSVTAARLLPFSDRALRLDPRVKDPVPYQVVMLDAVREMAGQFDVLHFHVDVLHYPLIRDFVDRTVTTLHGRLDAPEVRRLYSVFSGAPLVSISLDQRKPMPPVNWAGMVYHGLPRDLLPFSPTPRGGGYLAFLGRISPEKRPDRAIEIAARVGAPLKIAAKIDRVDQAYWDERIRPMVEGNPNVEFVGEIDERRKAQFLGDAAALLFPIDWPEPFGMVMIEAMACGTPVIAFRRGSSAEIVDDGLSGFLVDSLDEAVAAVRGLRSLDRRAARACFESRFTAERMAHDYLAIYQALPGVRGRARRLRPVPAFDTAPSGRRA